MKATRSPRIFKIQSNASKPFALYCFGAFVLCASFCFLATQTSAMPLATYRQHINRAIAAADEMTTAEDETQVAEALASIRRALPAHTEVEWSERRVQVDNSWLLKMLADYEAQRRMQTPAARRVALTAIAERLYVLDDRLAEADGADAEDKAEKEVDRERIAAILRGFAQSEQEEKDTALARLQDRIKRAIIKFLAWLRDLLPRPPAINPNIRPANSMFWPRFAQIVIYTLVLGFLALLAWRFGPQLIAYLRARKGRRRAARPTARVVLGERIEAEESSSDLLAEAERLARAGQVRAAIRKAYIAFLCELADRRQINLADHLTNRDYLQAVKPEAKLYALMQPLTLSYEKHWYGSENATEDDWTLFRTRYRTALDSSGV